MKPGTVKEAKALVENLDKLAAEMSDAEMAASLLAGILFLHEERDKQNRKTLDQFVDALMVTNDRELRATMSGFCLTLTLDNDDAGEKYFSFRF